MVVKIRKATLKDINQITKLGLEEERYFQKRGEFIYSLKNKECHKKVARENINKRKKLLLVAEENKRLVGYLYGAVWETPKMKMQRKGILNEIFLTQKYRGKGIANKLKDVFLKWLKGKKVEYVLLYVEKNNKKAIKVYNKWGFKSHYIEMLKKIK